MQQIAAGVNELNERVPNAEARATEAERQVHSTQQELARSQAGVKWKGKSAVVPLQQEHGIGTFASKCPPQPLEGEDDKRRERAQEFRGWFGRLKDTVTIEHSSLTWRSRL